MTAARAHATETEVAAARCLRALLLVYGLFLVLRGAIHLITGFFGPAPAASGLGIGFGIAFVLFDRRLAFLPFRWGAPSSSAAVCYLGAALAFLGAMLIADSADPLRVALGDLLGPGSPDLNAPPAAEPGYRLAEALPGVLVGVALFLGGRPVAAWWGRRNTVPAPTV